MIAASSVPNWMTARRRGAGIAPPEEHRNDLEMRGGGDGDEFGEALDEAEDDRFDDRTSTFPR